MSDPVVTKDMEHCIICGKPGVWHHLIPGTANRKKCDEDGLIIPLCPEHHNMSDMSVHFNKEMMAMSRIIAELAYEKEVYREAYTKQVGIDGDPAKEVFRARYGKVYI